MLITKMKAERTRRGWNQQTLGFHANVSVADISRIENARLIPYPAQAERLGKVLGLQPDELQQQVTAEAAASA
jgi:ribosome-binding protein aMBF1 (putative translation factor)